MSVIVHRSAPNDISPPPIILVAVRSTIDITAALAASVSGPLTDYDIAEVPTGASGPVWSLTAKQSYQDRFRATQQMLYLSESRLREAEEKLAIMERELEISLATVELYNRLERSKILRPFYLVYATL
jgi:hypothetical protein